MARLSGIALIFFMFIAWLAWVPLGAVVMCWIAAESPRDNHAIPDDWLAGVADHGTYFEWPLGTVRDSPLAFAWTVLLLTGCAVLFVVGGSRLSKETGRRKRRIKWWWRALGMLVALALIPGVFLGLAFFVTSLRHVPAR